MNTVQDALDSALSEVDKLRQTLRRGNSTQVQTLEERTFAKATALSWFNKHRSVIADGLARPNLNDIDEPYNHLLKFSEKNTTRSKYDQLLKELRKTLIEFRAANIVNIANTASVASTDKPPDFSTLVSDIQMRAILSRRWEECAICVHARAPLSAIVMMGGLLETLLLTRVHLFSDKPKVFNAKGAPKDKTGKPYPLDEWTLKNYIDVAHELHWITQTEKDLGVVLRDYRNYIHPYKERSHGIKLEPNDSLIIWELSKNICRQLLGVSTV
jgi:hypothetical protein